MRLPGLRVGLVSVLVACGALAAATAQEESKSYLPPKSYQGKAETSPLPFLQSQPARPARPARHASVRHRRVRTAAVYHPHRKRVRVAYHRHYRRYAYYRPYGFPFFFFNLF